MKKKSIYFITIVKRPTPTWEEVKNGTKGEKMKKKRGAKRLDDEEGRIALKVF